MSIKNFLLGIILSFFSTSIESVQDAHTTSFVIVTTSYNNATVYKENLDSVFKQDFDNWHMIYIDDKSPDGTGKLVQQYVKERGFTDKVTVICNTERCLALKNIVDAVYSCNDNDIIVSLDGDDQLSDSGVLTYLANIYQDPTIWLTYGSFKSLSTGTKCPWVYDYPQQVKEQRAFRSYIHTLPSHLRTFYAGLFKKIKIENLKYRGKFFEMTWDVAFMIPMIEMAASHYKFIDRVLYTYNDMNSINDHKVNGRKQMLLNKIIRSYPRYEELTTPPYGTGWLTPSVYP